jgi:two-component system cell cycle sensor histidine kinase/response regulator CckA
MAVGGGGGNDGAPMAIELGEPQHRVLIDELPLVTYVAPLEAPWAVLHVSPQIVALAGFPPEAWTSRDDFWLERVAPEDRAAFLAAFAELQRTERPVSTEYRLIARDGRVVWVRDLATVALGPDGPCVQGCLVDVTREKELERELLAARAEADAFFSSSSSSIGLAITDAEGRYVRVNEALARMNGIPAGEHIGHRLSDLAPLLAEHVDPMLEEVWRTGRPVDRRELNVDVPGRGSLTVLVSYFPIEVAGGARRYGGVVVDITEQRRAESQYRAVFDNALDAIVIADDEGRYVDVNPAACELLGRPREDLLGRTVRDVASPELEADEAWTFFLDVGEASGQFTIVRPDGTEREGEFAAKAHALPGRHLSVMRDVTQRKQLERELSRAQKLESVGRLAGGVAHDFNNLLTVIRGYTQLLLETVAPQTDERRYAEEVERAAERATALTAQLLAFGRRQVLQPRAIDLNRLVEGLSDLLSSLTPADVTLVEELEPALRAVRVDPAQLEQVVVNLVVNAAEAMPSGGRVVLRTRNVDVEHDPAAPEGAVSRELAGGRYVVLSVTDSGEGIDESTRERLFEPFFTTKEVGRGPGLGLATAYGIARQSTGTIVVASTPGRGSTFSVYLPAASTAVEGEPATGRGETVLVVESDPAVSDVVFEVLTDAGYRVLTARNARDVPALAPRFEGSIDLVVADAVSAAAVARDLRAGDRGLRTMEQLPRPFTAEELCGAVRAALDAARNG